ncbi:hypothetical protein Dm11a5_1201 [Dehalococcoides mccartyi]|uniref:Uncharacterized protein n=1 Tax=Dehalococcoides mccartyi TaxID=61435 RepID=A0A142VCH2_9CHLR|nr:hypothetical protein X794_05850 [Dehalococcoides mccartyi CG5]AMU87027.1 hypothetical protein Dm11a5_1201 [Dehalococcoides mccartyi]AOV99814.1 hypothetical protein DCWBC2_1191 [Dehalococcoides mccartyi]
MRKKQTTQAGFFISPNNNKAKTGGVSLHGFSVVYKTQISKIKY